MARVGISIPRISELFLISPYPMAAASVDCPLPQSDSRDRLEAVPVAERGRKASGFQLGPPGRSRRVRAANADRRPRDSCLLLCDGVPAFDRRFDKSPW